MKIFWRKISIFFTAWLNFLNKPLFLGLLTDYRAPFCMEQLMDIYATFYILWESNALWELYINHDLFDPNWILG